MTQAESKDPKWRARFIYRLPSLHEDRGAIATLRRGVSLQEEDWLAMTPYLYNVLGLPKGGLTPRERQAAYLIAALYADYDRPDLAPPMTDEGSMGSHFAALRKQAMEAAEPEEAEEEKEEAVEWEAEGGGLERRFLQLLGSHPDDLPLRLRSALRYLRAQSDPPVAINWRQLLDDFIAWGEEEIGAGWPVYYRSVQRRWAVDFWCGGDDGKGDWKEEQVAWRQWEETFIPSLVALAEDRGAMAALRRGVGMTVEGLAQAAPYLYGVLGFPAGEGKKGWLWERREWAAFLIAALFANYGGEAVGEFAAQLDEQARRKRPWKEKENLGHYFARLQKQGQEEHNRRVERHFTAVLDADVQDMALHLRSALTYLKSQSQSTLPICWEQLFQDLLYWDQEPRLRGRRRTSVQERWAEAFWRVESQPEDHAAQSEN